MHKKRNIIVMRFIVKEWKKINWAIGLLKKKVVKLQIIHCFMISKGGLHAFRPWLFPCLFIIFRFSFCLLNDKAFFFWVCQILQGLTLTVFIILLVILLLLIDKCLFVNARWRHLRVSHYVCFSSAIDLFCTYNRQSKAFDLWLYVPKK